MDFDKLAFEPLSADHDVSHFECGVKDLDEYLKGDALDEQEVNQATTTVILYEGQVVAYCTLYADSLAVSSLERRKRVVLEQEEVEAYPSVTLHVLAIHKPFQGGRGQDGKSFFRLIMEYVMGTAVYISMKWMGCRFLLIYALADRVSIYERFGFIRNEMLAKDGCLFMRLDLLPWKKAIIGA